MSMTHEEIEAARDTIRTALNIYGMEVDTFSAANALLYFNALCESTKATQPSDKKLYTLVRRKK